MYIVSNQMIYCISATIVISIFILFCVVYRYGQWNTEQGSDSGIAGCNMYSRTRFLDVLMDASNVSSQYIP